MNRLTKNLRDYYTTGMGGMSRLIFTEAWHLHTKRLYGGVYSCTARW